MAYDYKKEEKIYYVPGRKPALVDLPPMQYAAVAGRGNPNAEDGEYKRAVGTLYAVAYTIRMAPKSGMDIPDYFAFVVPPLEGLWSLAGQESLKDKDKLEWTAMIRLPEFVTEEIFSAAVAQAAEKKGIDAELPFLYRYAEGPCVQCLHVGSYDDEPATIDALYSYAAAQDLQVETAPRRHHEIYLSDPRRTAPEKLRTVIRLPVRPQSA